MNRKNDVIWINSCGGIFYSCYYRNVRCVISITLNSWSADFGKDFPNKRANYRQCYHNWEKIDLKKEVLDYVDLVLDGFFIISIKKIKQ